MKNKTFIHSILCGLVMAFSSHSIYADTPPVTRSASPCPGEFPIVALRVANKEKGPQPGDIKYVKECGFNLCMEEATSDRIEKLLTYMEGTGLKLLPYSYSFGLDDKGDTWKAKMSTFVNKFKNNPLVVGWDFGDEPQWAGLAAYQQRYEYLKKLDDSHFISYNLVGQMSKPFTGPCKDLSAYVDSIGERFDLDVLSSDYYPISIYKGQFRVNYKGFFENLSVFSKKSKEIGIPMWNYCESMEYETGDVKIPAATVPYLSFAIFSALSYGSQGIVYWPYWLNPSTPTYNLISALVDQEGNRSQAWYAAQKVNFQIRALTPVFLGAEMVEVRHTGMIGMDGTYPYIKDFGPLEELSNDVKGVLVSHLQNDGHNYLVIVNHDVVNKQKVKMKFRSNLNVTQFKASDSGKLTTSKVKSNLNATLSPGGYAIFEWH